MKLQFDSELLYQKQAIASVVDLFRGQTPKQSNFTVAAYGAQRGVFDSEHGIGNNLELNNEEILSNLQDVQLHNGLAQTKMLHFGEYAFDVEMETELAKLTFISGPFLNLTRRMASRSLLSSYHQSPSKRAYTSLSK